jgi:leader peptidase (prepilin peptidase)/N-methyltransferase
VDVSAIPAGLGPAVAFVWGAIWGSFFNVVVHRLPLGISLLHPPSRCPRCESRLAPYHNIPIFGWLLLRGRCAFCKAPISPRYPTVELTSAVLAVAVWLRVVPGGGADLAGAVAAFLALFFFVGALVVITFIDLDYRIIPHEITVPFLVAGVGVHALLARHTGVSWQESGIGVLLGAGVIWLIIQVYFWVRKREGMGGGDFVMMGMLGAWLGYKAILFILFAASVQGTLAAVVLYAARVQVPPPLPLPDDPPPEDLDVPLGGEGQEGFRTMEIPFGPFLALAGLEWLFFQPWIDHVLYGLYVLE